MTINISEELPARKHAPVADKKEGGEKPVAKGKKPAPGKTEENSAKSDGGDYMIVPLRITRPTRPVFKFSTKVPISNIFLLR